MPAPRNRKSGARKRSESLDQALTQLSRAYFDYVGLLERILNATGLGDHVAPGMGAILQALYENDDQIIKTIAERVCLSQSTLTGILHRMDQAGLIERRRDPQDGRATRVKLTDRGRNLESRWNETLDKMHSLITARVSETQLSAVKNGLTQLAEAMRAPL